MSRRRTAAAAVTTALTLALSVVGLGHATAATHHESAKAKPHIVLTGGSTTLALDPGTAQALTQAGLTITPASEATSGKAGLSFPIQGGLLNSKLYGTVTHAGGLTFTAGSTSATIRDFTVKVSKKKATLSAFVDGVNQRLTVLDLSIAKAKVTLTKKKFVATHIKATLDGAAAGALNTLFGTQLQAGLKIGTVAVKAHIKVFKG